MANSGKVWKLKNINQLSQANVNYRDATRGIYAIGYSPSIINTVEQVNLSAGGNATDYGDLTLAREHPATGSDSHGGLQSS